MEQKRTAKSSNSINTQAPSNTQDVKKKQIQNSTMNMAMQKCMIHQETIEARWMVMILLFQKNLINLKVQESHLKRKNPKKIDPRDLRYPPLTKSKVCQDDPSDPRSGDSSTDDSEPSRYRRRSPNQLFL